MLPRAVGRAYGLPSWRRLARSCSFSDSSDRAFVYLVFSLTKCVYEVVLAFVLPSLWMLLLGLVEIWIAKIIFMLWKAVGMIPPDRIEELLNPSFEQQHIQEAHIVYW